MREKKRKCEKCKKTIDRPSKQAKLCFKCSRENGNKLIISKDISIEELYYDKYFRAILTAFDNKETSIRRKDIRTKAEEKLKSYPNNGVIEKKEHLSEKKLQLYLSTLLDRFLIERDGLCYRLNELGEYEAKACQNIDTFNPCGLKGYEGKYISIYGLSIEMIADNRVKKILKRISTKIEKDFNTLLSIRNRYHLPPKIPEVTVQDLLIPPKIPEVTVQDLLIQPLIIQIDERNDPNQTRFNIYTRIFQGY